MRVVVQRVSSASVRVDGDLVAAIEEGLLVLVGIVDGDGPEDVATMAEKVAHLRIFPDAEGRMNCSVVDHGGAALVVSQFTLAADVRRGRRPSFTAAADPDRAAPMVESFAEHLRAAGIATATGVFGAMMDVALVNAGPVTIVIDVENGGFV